MGWACRCYLTQAQRAEEGGRVVVGLGVEGKAEGQGVEEEVSNCGTEGGELAFEEGGVEGRGEDQAEEDEASRVLGKGSIFLSVR